MVLCCFSVWSNLSCTYPLFNKMLLLPIKKRKKKKEVTIVRVEAQETPQGDSFQCSIISKDEDIEDVKHRIRGGC